VNDAGNYKGGARAWQGTGEVSGSALEAIACTFPDVEAQIMTLDIMDPISYGQIIRWLRKAVRPILHRHFFGHAADARLVASPAPYPQVATGHTHPSSSNANPAHMN